MGDFAAVFFCFVVALRVDSRDCSENVSGYVNAGIASRAHPASSTPRTIRSPVPPVRTRSLYGPVRVPPVRTPPYAYPPYGPAARTAPYAYPPYGPQNVRDTRTGQPVREHGRPVRHTSHQARTYPRVPPEDVRRAPTHSKPVRDRGNKRVRESAMRHPNHTHGQRPHGATQEPRDRWESPRHSRRRVIKIR